MGQPKTALCEKPCAPCDCGTVTSQKCFGPDGCASIIAFFMPCVSLTEAQFVRNVVSGWKLGMMDDSFQLVNIGQDFGCCPIKVYGYIPS